MGESMSVEELRALLSEVKAKHAPPSRRAAIHARISGTKGIRDGHRIDSKLEAARYDELSALELAGEVRLFLHQVPLRLPGGARYTVDFLVFWADGRVTWEETKGFAREAYKLRRAIAEHRYGIQITEIRARRARKGRHGK